MSEQTPTEPQPMSQPPRDDRPKRLFRSRRDRILAGVAGGLGDYFSVDPVIIRIAFAASVFIGGLGAFAYLAIAIFVPARPLEPGESPTDQRELPRWIAWIAAAVVIVAAIAWGAFDHRPFDGPFFLGPPLVLLALIAGAVYIARGSGGSRISGPGGVIARLALAAVAFVALCLVALASAWATATGHGVAVAVLVVGIGLALIATSARGNARWLVVPAIALAAPLGAVAAADISFADGVGDREYKPASLADVPADGYELGVGRLVVDLRDAPWKRGDVQALDVDLGVGQLIVAVPHDVCVSADLHAGAGDLDVTGEQSHGVDVDSDANGSASATPRLQLKGRVDLGNIRIVNDDDASLRGHGPGHEAGSTADLREACAAHPADAAAKGGRSKSASAPDPAGTKAK